MAISSVGAAHSAPKPTSHPHPVAQTKSLSGQDHKHPHSLTEKTGQHVNKLV